MQPQPFELDRAPHVRPARETAPPSFLARTRSAVRDRLRGALGPNTVGLPAADRQLRARGGQAHGVGTERPAESVADR